MVCGAVGGGGVGGGGGESGQWVRVRNGREWGQHLWCDEKFVAFGKEGILEYA
jgi:hypothetical protein